MNVPAVLLTAFVMALGVAGTVLPVLPGLGLILVAGVVYGIVVGFGVVGWTVVVLMAALALGGTGAKYVVAGRRAAGSEPATTTLLFATVGGIVGFFVIPVVGFPIGGALGVLVAQYRRTGDRRRAWTATRSVLVGFGLGALVEVATGLAMVVAWLVWVFWG